MYAEVTFLDLDLGNAFAATKSALVPIIRRHLQEMVFCFADRKELRSRSSYYVQKTIYREVDYQQIMSSGCYVWALLVKLTFRYPERATDTYLSPWWKAPYITNKFWLAIRLVGVYVFM